MKKYWKGPLPKGPILYRARFLGDTYLVYDEYVIVKKTSRGCWYADIDTREMTWRKRKFAFPTKEEAFNDLKRRTIYAWYHEQHRLKRAKLRMWYFNLDPLKYPIPSA